ncbi:aminotransferase class V-fold PLP-dependent enzyme [Paenibacillus glucanolyticus]|uniref:aminotransferase class I/II-fold pyridoxal phosphate-dependent enzyme n=1 Tax=Paenibacillus TaxID=44249 RepID=UPI0003E2223C|nr:MULTISPECIES: aminotransferase class I/II-fold pyridoxal phosphate-dependent enzyme [Paenibacillus]ANA78737.1 aromatic amino acid aminotransferase [Paenibacillus glucanolyticus]AVV57349.1 aminotransferase class V-fold PLP-dependent enzyme [Paenibacillus glucanolyticus]ETT35254.1 class I/II aminotransferase [Paenibacillus sp. FSL R5-808]MPY16834.1 aminotransferase class I/II-fold pyridoxal phosphate-dependent enzyme [Paenibacillus glucanolyticus]
MNTTSSFISPTVQDMPPSGIRQFFNAAEADDDVISLGVGEPDFVTPQCAIEACKRALEHGRTMYTPNEGLLELREAIAEYLHKGFQLEYEPSREVLVTVGGSEAIDLALRALISPGDEIIIPVPGYIAYAPLVQLNGGKVVELELSAEEGFKLTADELQKVITPRTKAIVVNFPTNPTGAVMTYEDWLPIARLAVSHNLVVISDEMYADLTYGRTHTSIASLPGMRERTIVISGFSKAFAMTGWRVGYLCGDRDLVSAMVKIHQYTALCAPIMGQIAAIECLRNGLGDRDAMKLAYDERRRMFVQGLSDIGLTCRDPQGAFYAFPSIAETGLGSQQFAERLLREAKVAVVPGHVFGAGGEGFIRCSYAASSARLTEALDRIDLWLRAHSSRAAQDLHILQNS